MRRHPQLGLALISLALLAAACKRPVRQAPPDIPPPLPLEQQARELPPASAPVEVAATPLPLHEEYGLPLRAARGGCSIYSKSALAVEDLARIADETRQRVGGWLALDASAESLDILLGEDLAEVRALQRDLGLPPSASTGPGGETTSEGFFPKRRLILLVASAERNLPWLVSHEVCHSVFRQATRSHPVALNEGLAEVLPSWILFAGAPSPEETRARYSEYEAVLARLARERDVPELERFVTLTWERFHADRWRNFALAWSLAKLLVESEEPGIRGRFPDLARQLGAHDSPWDDFREVYDARQVERAWHTSIESFATAAE